MGVSYYFYISIQHPPLEGLITLCNDGMLFTVDGKVVYFRISLPKEKRGRTELSAKLLSGIILLHYKESLFPWGR